MQQQNSYLRNNNQPTGSNPYSTHNQSLSLNQPQVSLSLNQPQGSYQQQPQASLSFQAQGHGQPNYQQQNSSHSNYAQGNSPQNTSGQSNYGNNSYGQNNYSQSNLGQNNYGQTSSGQFSLGINATQNSSGQFNLGVNNNSGQNNFGQQNQNSPQAPLPEENAVPTTSAEIAAYMKKRPYTQMLGGDEFTFSVLPKKQATFVMTHERLLMLKGNEMIAYAREFPANKQLPFASLADVPAPKVSYPLAQVEKADVADAKLIITFAGPTKVTWEFVTPNKNSAIEWAQKIDAAKQSAINNGAQTNFNYKYDEDVLGRSVYDSPQKPQQQGLGINVGDNSFSINANSSGLNVNQNNSYGYNSSPNSNNYGLNNSPNKNIRIEERSTFSTNSFNNNGSGLGSNTYGQGNNNYNQGNNYNQNSSFNVNTNNNQYSSSYQTGTPERNQSTFSLNAQVTSNPQNYNYQSTTTNYGTNSNYQPANSNYQQGNYETRENKQSFSTQGQSTYSQSSGQPTFSVSASNMARYPLSGQASLQSQTYQQRGYEPPRHF